MTTSRPRLPLIGVSACMFQPDPERPIFKGKRLLYSEESMFHWIMRGGRRPLGKDRQQAGHQEADHGKAMAVLVPTPAQGTPSVKDIVCSFDGLLLSGGVDVAPETYGETPLRDEWSGDSHRDAYEIDLLHASVKAGIPVLGICRGAQVINVAYGGTLFQDIKTQNPQSLVHRDWEVYEDNCHQMKILPGTGLAKLYPGISECRINSIHHQGIKDIGRGLKVEATSLEDGVIEAIRFDGASRSQAGSSKPRNPLSTLNPWVFGVQWHPEFQDPADESLLPTGPILEDFLNEVTARRDRREST